VQAMAQGVCYEELKETRSMGRLPRHLGHSTRDGKRESLRAMDHLAKSLNAPYPFVPPMRETLSYPPASDTFSASRCDLRAYRFCSDSLGCWNNSNSIMGLLI